MTAAATFGDIDEERHTPYSWAPQHPLLAYPSLGPSP
jgi:hypothetical protein